ncbi:MAG TPA: amidase, partial [Reyranella sp.]|nr:amidase [Reyranella sp.]
MNETDLCFTPATELVDAVRAKKLSAVEITTVVLNRVAALEPRLNGFAYVAAEEAMDAAVAA